MATFQIRKNGSVSAKIRRHGVSLSETFSKREDAEAWARKKESEIERGLWRDMSLAEQTTIADLCKEYRKKILPTLKGRGTAPALNIIEDQLGKIILVNLTAQTISKYRDGRLKVVSQESVRKELGTLSKMIDTAIKEWGITLPANPCMNVRRPPPGKPRDRRLYPGEYERIETALRQCRNPYMLPLFRFALETAGRQGELLNLRWSNIDKQRKIAMFLATKNGEDRATPLSSIAVSILDTLPRSLKDNHVFPVTQSLVGQAWGHAITRARRQYEKELQKSGVTFEAIVNDPLLLNLTFHDLRHEALSRLAERGDLNVIELASISGHKTLQMLKRYTHLQAVELAKKLG